MTKLVGITGGIGSGKTTLSNHLKKLGYLVHESDAVVSEMYTKPKKQFLSFIKEKISQDAVNHNKINKNKNFEIISLKRQGKMPHNGYRPISNNRIKKLFPNFKFKTVADVLNKI